jgi:PPOX class probable FMN-dependent enzyme
LGVTNADDQLITSIEQLETIYHDPVTTSVMKELDHITDDYRQFIDAAPFVVLATAGPEGLDCSPRGDPAGFVRVVDSRTIMIPDRRGNNRVDSLRNIVRDPRVALLFLVPGVNETMRINGTAVLSTDAQLRQSFAMGDKLPACVIVITVDRIYPQCPKALVRSKLWDATMHIPRSALPTTGEMLQRITDGAYDGAAHDAAYPERLRQTIY